VTRDDDRTARQISRSKTKRAGDRSAKIARTFMELKDSQLAKLDLHEDLRGDVTRARKVSSHIARRRAERTLAGDLRKYDLAEVDEQLEKLAQGAVDDSRMFHAAEQWRARLIAEGMAAAADLPGEADPELPRLIDAAQRERDTGKPPGAQRALFRHIVERLKP
jgi:ribosome-associated protein